MVPTSVSADTLSWTLSRDSISTKSDRACTMLLTIILLASSLTAHRSEKRIIFKRCLAIFALELLLVVGDGNIIFQAKFKRSKKFMLMALRRKLSESWLLDFDESWKSPLNRLECWRILRLSNDILGHFSAMSEMLDPPFEKLAKSTYNTKQNLVVEQTQRKTFAYIIKPSDEIWKLGASSLDGFSILKWKWGFLSLHE